MNETRHAILIANSKFPHEKNLHELHYPLNDARGLQSVLESDVIGRFDSVLLLENENSQDIRLALNKSLNALNPNDLVLIYYSGHGKMSRANVLCLATQDTQLPILESTSFPIESLHLLLKAAQLNKVILILDCCFSGAVGMTVTRGNIADQLQVAMSGTGYYILTASTEIQMAHEYESDQYSVFTKHLIAGIKSGSAGSANAEVITMDDIYSYIRRNIVADAPMEPMRWAIDQAGHMIIAYKHRDDPIIKIHQGAQAAYEKTATYLLGYVDWANNLHGAFSDQVQTLLTHKPALDALVQAAETYNKEVTELLPKLPSLEIEINKQFGSALGQYYTDIHKRLRDCNSKKVKALNDIRTVLNPLFSNADAAKQDIAHAENVRGKIVDELGVTLERLSNDIENFLDTLRNYRGE